MSSTVQRIDVVKGHRLCAGREKLWRRVILALDRLFALNRLLALGLLLGLMVAGTGSASGLPAFARKTGLRCSACHEAWPKLSPFGQTFRDNGYQIGNERDSPVYLSPFYWPIAVRYTPQWHAERNSAVATDQAASGVQPVSTQGFDGSGVDLWFAGLLSKNISFVILPSSDEYGNFHFESGWVRFDNLLGSTWLNLKGGKFELDTLVSEKRMLTLSQNGGFYQMYHYLPSIDQGAYASTATAPGELGASTTTFGLGDNQLGMELMGHSKNDYTRYSAALITSSDGSFNLPTSSAYDTFLTGSHSFNAGGYGLQRIGAFTYLGQSPTRFLTQASVPIAGSGYGNKGFTRTGAFGLFKVKKFDIVPMYTHATESAFVAVGIPSDDALPAGVRSPTWNGRMLELNYVPTLQYVVTARYEDIRNSRQIFAASKSNFGDLDAETIAFRWYPFMTSRDGLAIHLEYSKVHSIGLGALETNQTLRSGFIGMDFAF